MKPTGLVHRDMHNQMIADRDDEIARLKAEVETAKAWQSAAVLRNYDAAHILSAEIGAWAGPENVDATARRAAMLIARLRAALAAGPAALRALAMYGGNEGGAAEIVERAQERALKGGG